MAAKHVLEEYSPHNLANAVEGIFTKNHYAPLRNSDMVTLQHRLSGKIARKSVNLNLQQKGLLKMMHLKMPKMIM
jgi:hypothetical protein